MSDHKVEILVMRKLTATLFCCIAVCTLAGCSTVPENPDLVAYEQAFRQMTVAFEKATQIHRRERANEWYREKVLVREEGVSVDWVLGAEPQRDEIDDIEGMKAKLRDNNCVGELLSNSLSATGTEPVAIRNECLDPAVDLARTLSQFVSSVRGVGRSGNIRELNVAIRQASLSGKVLAASVDEEPKLLYNQIDGTAGLLGQLTRSGFEKRRRGKAKQLIRASREVFSQSAVDLEKFGRAYIQAFLIDLEDLVYWRQKNFNTATGTERCEQLEPLAPRRDKDGYQVCILEKQLFSVYQSLLVSRALKDEVSKIPLAELLGSIGITNKAVAVLLRNGMPPKSDEEYAGYRAAQDTLETFVTRSNRTYEAVVELERAWPNPQDFTPLILEEAK